MLTGLYCEDTGVYSNEGAWRKFRLPRPLETFPRVFARHGYATANFGKVHLPLEMQDRAPAGREVFQVHDENGGEMDFFRDLGEAGVQMIRTRNGRGGMEGGVFPDGYAYPPERVTRNGLDWMAAAQSPFLIRFSYLQPHTPVLPPAEFAGRYAAECSDWRPQYPVGMSRYEKLLAAHHELDAMDPRLFATCCAHYYGQVAWIDQQVGRILDAIDTLGRSSETIVILTSDHGKGLGESGAFEKHCFAPPVHRIPLLMAWPGSLPSSQVNAEISESLDLARTLFDLAGIPAPGGFKGRSLVSQPAPEAVYATLGHGRPFSRMGPNSGKGCWHGGRGWPRRACVRTARWRYEKNILLDGKPPETAEDADIFMADTQNDPAEIVNLAARPETADTAAWLDARLAAHAAFSVEVPDACLRR